MICPICKKTVTESAPEFPFCGERCRLIDLGNWASGTYKISLPLRDEEPPDLPSGFSESPESKDK